ncbi:tol-pal system YbgF family protein, partial [Planctomycetota bacterium]
GTDKDQSWKIGTGGKVKTDWVKFECVPAKGKKKTARSSARPTKTKSAQPAGDPNEKKAAVFWDMAQDAIKNGNTDMARYSLKQIIMKYPKTSYAAKAEKAMSNL